MINGKLKKIINYFRAILSLLKDKNRIRLLLPTAPRIYSAKGLYRYYWFDEVFNWSNITSLNVKGGIYIWRPTYAVLGLQGLSYDTYFSNSIRSAERALIRKAEKNGFTMREIKYDDYLDEVLAINISKGLRQGGAMTDDYTHVVPRDKILKEVGAENYTYGCFSADGKLVAYYVFERITNFYHVLKGIGHGDYLKYGIMNYLFAHAVSMLPTDNGKIEYVIYGTCTERGEGVFKFKRNVGCKINHLMFVGDRKQKHAFKYFRKNYYCHDDSPVHYVKNYVLKGNDQTKKI